MKEPVLISTPELESHMNSLDCCYFKIHSVILLIGRRASSAAASEPRLLAAFKRYNSEVIKWKVSIRFFIYSAM